MLLALYLRIRSLAAGRDMQLLVNEELSKKQGLSKDNDPADDQRVDKHRIEYTDLSTQKRVLTHGI